MLLIVDSVILLQLFKGRLLIALLFIFRHWRAFRVPSAHTISHRSLLPFDSASSSNVVTFDPFLDWKYYLWTPKSVRLFVVVTWGGVGGGKWNIHVDPHRDPFTEIIKDLFGYFGLSNISNFIGRITNDCDCGRGVFLIYWQPLHLSLCSTTWIWGLVVSQSQFHFLPTEEVHIFTNHQLTSSHWLTCQLDEEVIYGWREEVEFSLLFNWHADEYFIDLNLRTHAR